MNFIIKKSTVFTLSLLSILLLEGCGKKGPPTVPAGEEDQFPTLYPFVEEPEELQENASRP